MRPNFRLLAGLRPSKTRVEIGDESASMAAKEPPSDTELSNPRDLVPDIRSGAGGSLLDDILDIEADGSLSEGGDGSDDGNLDAELQALQRQVAQAAERKKQKKAEKEKERKRKAKKNQISKLKAQLAKLLELVRLPEG